MFLLTNFFRAAFFRGSIDRKGSLSLFDLGRKLFHAFPPRMEVQIGINQEFITVTDPNKNESLLVQRIIDCHWLKIGEYVMLNRYTRI